MTVYDDIISGLFYCYFGHALGERGWRLIVPVLPGLDSVYYLVDRVVMESEDGCVLFVQLI